ncbi:hypothetical protein D3C71_1962560 [compost metagenome]
MGLLAMGRRCGLSCVGPFEALGFGYCLQMLDATGPSAGMGQCPDCSGCCLLFGFYAIGNDHAAAWKGYAAKKVG